MKVLHLVLFLLSCCLVINAESYSLRESHERELQENVTGTPTDAPTQSPTESPTLSPTSSPTKNPTKSPTNSPTVNPTASPTTSPTVNPTNSPTQNPTFSPTTSPTNNPTQNPTVTPTENPTQEQPDPAGVDLAVIGGAIGGVFCLFVIGGAFFIFVLLGRRTNRVRAGDKPVDENLIRSMALLDEKKREIEQSKRIAKKGKERRKASLDEDKEAQITDLRGKSTATPPAPMSVISAASQPPPGMASKAESVISNASSQAPPGMYGPPGVAPPGVDLKPKARLSEQSVGSRVKLDPPGPSESPLPMLVSDKGPVSQMSIGSPPVVLPGSNRMSNLSAASSQGGIPRLSSGNVNSLPRVMSKSLEKQKVTAALKEKQGSNEKPNIDKKPSVLDE